MMHKQPDVEYLETMAQILQNGIQSDDRTGIGTISQFGPQMSFNLDPYFPLLTTKKINFQLIVSELLWFLRGDTNIKYLLQHQNHIWTEWAFEKWIQSKDFQEDLTFKTEAATYGLNLRFKNDTFNQKYKQLIHQFENQILTNPEFAQTYGDLGPVYGKQWRNFNGIDQIAIAIDTLKTNPSSRRNIISAWNPKDIPTMALPPCHTLFQLYVRNNKLSLKLYQRSADLFLGVPFNIASYALLTHILAKQADLGVDKLILTFGDAHIYKNHTQQVLQQLDRTPTQQPMLQPFEKKALTQYTPQDFILTDYEPHPYIKAPIAI